MAASHNFLLISVQPDTTSGSVFPRSAILGWNGIGWQAVGELKTGALSDPFVFKPLFVSSVFNSYRVWRGRSGAGSTNFVGGFFLQESIINPDHAPTPPTIDASVQEHHLPEFDAGQARVEKLALSLTLEVEAIGANAFGSVEVHYLTNFSGDTTIGTITTAGETTFTFPDNGTNPDIGTLFRWIQIYIKMTRGSGTKSTPDVRSTTLEYRKKLPEKLGFRCQLDLTQDSPDGKTPQEQLAGLVTARNSTTLIEFTFRNDDSGNRTYYTDIQDASSQEDTGLDEAGLVTLTLVEP
jgi:hypothetical protein